LIDLTTAAASALTAVRVMENRDEHTALFVFLGPCSFIGNNFCRMCQAIAVNMVEHSSLVLLLSFVYRLHILQDTLSVRYTPPRTLIWLICALPLLLIVPLMVGNYIEQKPVTDEGRRRFH
ncbi:hypothetical protein PENTCL1PPCAC_30657, partial [Pristionchus entomophagus]